MKSNFKIFFIIIAFFYSTTIALSNEFKFEASQLNYLSESKILEGIGKIKITDKDNTEIYADKFQYNEETGVLNLDGNIKFLDKINSVILNTQQLTYYQKLQKIVSNKKVNIVIQNKYTLISNNIEYLQKVKKISSNTNSTFKDNIGNIFQVKNYDYYINKKIISGKNIRLTDLKENTYIIEDATVNLTTNEIRGRKINLTDVNQNNYLIENAIINLNSNIVLGKDVVVNLNKNTFDNPDNDPRMKGNSITADKNTTILTKGVFTTCKLNDKCPPWLLSADKIEHNKKTKQIRYKNAWLKLYDVPVLYFPTFFHPDPTVKRQSGFLIPKINNSNTFGSILSVPYFHVLSDNKDLTFSPRLYSNNDVLLQSEYRQVNKNNKHIVDASLYTKSRFGLGTNESKGHFFLNSNYSIDLENFEETSLEINLQQASKKKFLKNYSITSPLVENNTTLNSYFNFSANREDLSIKSSVEIFENLNTESSHDRFEFIYPRIEISKDLGLFEGFDGDVIFNSNFYQKKYNTNIYEGALINDLRLNSNTNFLNSGFLNNFKVLLKNVNTNSNNSNRYKNKHTTQILSAMQFQTSYPLIKSTDRNDNLLTPIASVMFSPNKSKNIKNENRRINTDNIFSLDRIANSETVEGGLSLTLGSNYKKTTKQNKEIVSLDLGQVFRIKKNDDLPLNSTIGDTSQFKTNSKQIFKFRL